jgi:adenylate cyclase
VQNQVDSANLAQSTGEEKTIAILFSDIVAYTPFAETVSPYDTIHVLNRYFRLMGKIIQRHNGHISDYIGDGIMALFGLSNTETAVEEAVKAGIEMFNTLPELNTYLKQMYNKAFQIRIGIHYDKVVIGNVGIDNMNKLAAVGDAVNLASRIEHVNRDLGTHFLLSEEAYQQVGKDIRATHEYTTSLKGKKGFYKFFEIDPAYSLLQPMEISATYNSAIS